jgi:hypothetical protein
MKNVEAYFPDMIDLKNIKKTAHHNMINNYQEFKDAG